MRRYLLILVIVPLLVAGNGALLCLHEFTAHPEDREQLSLGSKPVQQHHKQPPHSHDDCPVCQSLAGTKLIAPPSIAAIACALEPLRRISIVDSIPAISWRGPPALARGPPDLSLL
jgi:hypothetical protein